MNAATSTPKPSRLIKPALKLVSPVHRFVFRASRGRLGSRLGGMPVLLLTTVGNKSGKTRTLPLTYVPEGDTLLVVASTGGLQRHPGWYHNLVARPDVTVEIDGRIEERRAEPVMGDEYQRLWAKITSAYPQYSDYERTANRQIPIVALYPATQRSGASGQKAPMVDSLYREIILDHYRNPRNHGTLDPADISHEELNPLCGDEIRIDARITDGVISEIAFDGRGCAVSQASASILTEMVLGKPVEEAKALTKDDLLEELAIPVSAARMKCALLGLKALKAGLYGTGSIRDDEM